MKRATLLRRVRKRLALPERWTKFVPARAEYVPVKELSQRHPVLSHQVLPSDPTAVCWCITGAMEAEWPQAFSRVSYEDWNAARTHKRYAVKRAQMRALQAAIIKLYGKRDRAGHGVDFNNHRHTTHADILWVLDEAIVAYEASA